MTVTRFAPSPTGPLHLGHAYSALLAQDLAQTAGGRFLLRIEDIDRARARPHWEAQIYDDLQWLGLSWPEPVMRQSDRQAAYDAALHRLWEAGLLYPCRCARRDIAAAVSAPQEGAPPPHGPDGLVYPGTCRPATPPTGPMPQDVALRLDMARALALRGPPVFAEEGPDHAGQITPGTDHMATAIGDVVLARRDMGTSYHLSVVVDDAAQGVTLVTRGADLFEATAIHVLLQALLDLPRPRYHHHRLIRDAAGKRLAKRDDARAIALYREGGQSPADLRRMIGL
ncbi:tRNA glutamyl-Q(34) synthetase GluQRS [Pseudooceanicola aestuarii]|uniref:tRNA glutamyl-Q(34) synthetase GluQRS n=1 Tax=Pseudooceanicola aestuarii TaxID=2697319 RepID=UPI0013D6FB94|nr:tRNA glutamyl-Q(34) synthetase GluQRS [Pseudooceanicola aestuarii]